MSVTRKIFDFLIDNTIEAAISIESNYPAAIDLMENAIKATESCTSYVAGNLSCFKPTFLLKAVEYCLWQKDVSVDVFRCDDATSQTSNFNVTACVEESAKLFEKNGKWEDSSCWHNRKNLILISLSMASFLTFGLVKAHQAGLFKECGRSIQRGMASLGEATALRTGLGNR